MNWMVQAAVIAPDGRRIQTERELKQEEYLLDFGDAEDLEYALVAAMNTIGFQAALKAAKEWEGRKNGEADQRG